MRKLIESVDAGIATEGPMGSPMMTPPMPPEDKGNPVTVNVSMNASGKEHVADLLDMMKNAGLGGAEEVSVKTLSPRMDMEKFRDIVDTDGDSMPKADGDVDEWANSAPGEVDSDRGTMGCLLYTSDAADE